MLAALLPEIVRWIVRSLAEGREAETDLRAMLAAEEAARIAERLKFGPP